MQVGDHVAFEDIPERLVVFTIQALLQTRRVRFGSLACPIQSDNQGRPIDITFPGSIEMRLQMRETVAVAEILPEAHWITHGTLKVPGLNKRKIRPEKFRFGCLIPCQAIFVINGDRLCTRNTSGQCSQIRWDPDSGRWYLVGLPVEMDRDRVVTVIAFARPNIIDKERPVPGNQRRR